MGKKTIAWPQPTVKYRRTEHIERVERHSAEGEESYDGLKHGFCDADKGGGKGGADRSAEKLGVRQEGTREHEKNERGKKAGS